MESVTSIPISLQRINTVKPVLIEHLGDVELLTCTGRCSLLNDSSVV